MTEREALKLALKDLKRFSPYFKIEDTITAIKEALAQPEQEPVAWRYRMPVEDGHWVWNYATYIDDPKDQRCEPLYTTPPQRTWVGLTENEFKQIMLDTYNIDLDVPGHSSDDHLLWKAIEEKLRRKNT